LAGSELWSLPFININNKNEGEIITLGEDGQGNKIFALSVQGDRELINRLIESFLSIFKHAPDDLHIVNIRFRDNGFLLAGRILCRAAFFAPLGRLFVLAGVKKIYGPLSRLVNDQKDGKGKLP